MISNRIRIPRPILSIFLALTTTNALAAGFGDITDAEWALLPKYCPYTQGYKGHVRPYIDKWEAVMGPTFFHVHHYCWGLLKYRRAERAMTPTQAKRDLREQAVDDFRYVVKNSEKDFVLLPEILTWIGRTEILLRHPDQADQAFGQARTLKPDYWPAYSHWAEYLLANGRKMDALSVVKTGLQYSPGSKVLLSQYRSLGGKPENIPPPIIKAEEPPAAPANESPQQPEPPVAPVSPSQAPN